MLQRRRYYLRWLSRLLGTGLILTVVVLIAAVLWLLLHSAGDRAGSEGVRGVLLTAAVFWCLNFIALVVFCALSQLAGAATEATHPSAAGPCCADTLAAGSPGSSVSSSSPSEGLTVPPEDKRTEDG